MLFLVLQQQQTSACFSNVFLVWFFLTLKELIRIFPTRTVTIYARTNQSNVSTQPWTCWEKITFHQSFFSKHQILSFENCILGKKKEVEGHGDISKILDMGSRNLQ